MVVNGVKAVQYAVGQIRTGAVSGCSLQFDIKAVSAGKDRARLCGNGSCLNIPLNMGRDTRIDRKLHDLYDIRKQIFYLTAAFLSPLKAEYDISV